MITVGIIGAGLIGRERLLAVKALADKGRPVSLAGIYDINQELCRQTSAEFGVSSFETVEQLFDSRPDWIIIGLPHDVAVEMALRALALGGNVLIEKPMGRDLNEARRLLEAGGKRLNVGFNYRFFPGVRRALQDARKGAFGQMIAAQFAIGHGGSPGQEKTWKLDPVRAGGGCLIDPGVHLLDLILLLAPDHVEVEGAHSWAGFWKRGIEEDARILLSSSGWSISLDVSIVNWRSVFRIDLLGTEGYGLVAGRNRSYGHQTYTRGPRWGWRIAENQRASEQVVVESDGNAVFSDETEALLFSGLSREEDWPAPCTATEALSVMQLLDRIRERLHLPQDYSL
jgi:predicted dehydrogenase